ncbi:LLM class flavin-dependent oxidoreductase [Nonomuraea angiospora]|uniref:Alkanesulfonate monooxygenase SsuD/methylene tetrahydromethanopterin reductase-like flavin-dependent oxidoreductase (Luciferase family) n=1 Tax=Nonomuraea angiospora TaxID=46172 RepID=A0ABR9MFH5_9ACTN|nr:LLM class flavin-dependent oxidoreductase [Nonomuraea angiospora]MBE1591666.1 alkanesulfonate monooxygenase SsuD/methylene tetrahydromethanopterin reductase-like flavin-dependent oxidoreductase (luciferase family) [Nonomuraea angiospora]
MTRAPLHLAVALDGAGWHPAAWRDPAVNARELFTARHWAGLVAEAERGLLDFVTIEDALGLQTSRLDGPDERTGEVRGRFDAVLLAAALAPLTTRIGLVPTATTTHTEPFHVAIGIASLDHVSLGRAGWRVQVSARAWEAAHFGRRQIPALIPKRDTAGQWVPDEQARELIADLFEEAADAVEVARRLWDSWEDDAEIRDVATGRFVDRDKLHYIDFAGSRFSVKGPSITPRPPQGQPVVTVLDHGGSPVPYELPARAADVVLVTPHSRDHARDIVEQVRSRPRDGHPLKVLADLLVHVGDDAAGRKARLDELAAPPESDAYTFAGTAAELADLLLDWREAGIEGYRLRPAAVPSDLAAITRELAPELRRRGAFRSRYEAATLRGHLGLPHAINRYASQKADIA